MCSLVSFSNCKLFPFQSEAVHLMPFSIPLFYTHSSLPFPLPSDTTPPIPPLPSPSPPLPSLSSPNFHCSPVLGFPSPPVPSLPIFTLLFSFSLPSLFCPLSYTSLTSPCRLSPSFSPSSPFLPHPLPLPAPHR